MADLGFQLAAQPDMVLSVEKDIFYTKQIRDQLKVSILQISRASASLPCARTSMETCTLELRA